MATKQNDDLALVRTGDGPPFGEWFMDRGDIGLTLSGLRALNRAAVRAVTQLGTMSVDGWYEGRWCDLPREEQRRHIRYWRWRAAGLRGAP